LVADIPIRQYAGRNRIGRYRQFIASAAANLIKFGWRKRAVSPSLPRPTAGNLWNNSRSKNEAARGIKSYLRRVCEVVGGAVKAS